MKRSFTLLEVLIATIILLVSATIFFEVTSNTKHLVNLYIKNKEKFLTSSIVLENTNAKNAYETLIGFQIDNDKIIKYLKTQKVDKKIMKEQNIEVIEINNIKYYRFF